MLKRAIASLAVVTLIGLAPVPEGPLSPLTVSAEQEGGKLNYYRSPGGEPYCVQRCDGQGHCCTF